MKLICKILVIMAAVIGVSSCAQSSSSDSSDDPPAVVTNLTVTPSSVRLYKGGAKYARTTTTNRH